MDRGLPIRGGGKGKGREGRGGRGGGGRKSGGDNGSSSHGKDAESVGGSSTGSMANETVLRENEKKALSNNSGAKTYNIKLENPTTITFSAYKDVMLSLRSSWYSSDRDEILQALNILLGHYAKSQSNVTTLSQNRHFSRASGNTDRHDLGLGLEAKRGFSFSVRPATSRLLVNVQVKNVAFYQPRPLHHVAEEFLRQHGKNYQALLRFVRKVRVEVNYDSPHVKGVVPRRYKTVSGLATTSDGKDLDHPPKIGRFGAGAHDVKFWLNDIAARFKQSKSLPGLVQKTTGGANVAENENYKSVFDYFKDRYGILIQNTDLPVVNVGTVKQPSYLPMQICTIRAGQPAACRLDRPQTQKMIEFAVRKPQQNAESILTTGPQILGFTPDHHHLAPFGVTVQPHMIPVPGRVLGPPGIQYGNNKSLTSYDKGGWNLRQTVLQEARKMQQWTWLNISVEKSAPNMNLVSNSWGSFVRCLRSIGIQCGDPVAFDPPVMHHVPIEPGDPENKILSAIKGISSAFASGSLPLLVVIIPAQDSVAAYNRVKYACDVECGLRNVCILDSKLGKNLPKNDDGAAQQYFANVRLKINLKLGGSNHILHRDQLGFIRDNKTIIIGIEVTHPSPGSSSQAPSIAAAVASVDDKLAQWPAIIRVQKACEEMIKSLEEMVVSRILLFRKTAGRLPLNLLVYRDGASEGQYQQVLEEELPAIRQACKRTCPGKVKITVVIVGKRHHTRFYASDTGQATENANPVPGNIVDRGVREASNWDFFLQSHHAIQGTAKPLHYFVVYDQIFSETYPYLKHQQADMLETITHNLCYTFGRATKAVSVCPPAYYADLACERARCYLSHLFAPAPGSSDAESSSDAVVEGEEEIAPTISLQIHKDIENTMFYI